MSRDQIKTKFRENAIAYTIIALLSSGGGSAVTSLRGPSEAEIDSIQGDVQSIKVEVARMNQKLDDFIDHSRETRRTARSE